MIPFVKPDEAAPIISRLLPWDLERYVAPSAIKDFFYEYAPAGESSQQQSNDLEALDDDVLQAVADGRFANVGSETSESAKVALLERQTQQDALNIVATSFVKKFAPEPEDRTGESNSSDSPCANLEENGFAMPARRQPAYSPEAQSLLDSYAMKHGVAGLTPEQLRDGFIAAHVLGMGWTLQQFIGDPRGGEPGEILGADIAILREHPHEALQGARSTVASSLLASTAAASAV